MDGVTDYGLLTLAKACPNLKKVQLQETTGNTDAGHLTFLVNCPKITFFETIGSELSGNCFIHIKEHPEWAPKLKKLRVC